MPLLAKETGGASFDPVPAGGHVGRCYAVVDLGTHHDERYNKDQRRVLCMFEIPGERIQIERDGETQDLPRAISNQYTLSLGEKANLRKDLQSWRGKQFTAKELDGFDLAKVVGIPAFLQVVHNSKGDKTYANIDAIIPVPKGLPVPKAENEPVFFSLDDKPEEIPESIPDWVAKIIRESVEWRAEHGEPEEDNPFPDAENAGSNAEPDFSGDDEDDIPF